ARRQRVDADPGAHQAPAREPRHRAAGDDRSAVRRLSRRGRHRSFRGSVRPDRPVSPDFRETTPAPAGAPLPALPALPHWLEPPAGRGAKLVAPALHGSSDALALAVLAKSHGPIAVLRAEP